MGLPWVRLDSNIASHDKILELLERRNGRGIAFTYICCIAYSGQNGTDGHIPFAALPFVHGTKTDMQALVSVGLLTPTPKGWQVNNYADRQQTSFVTSEIRAAQTVGGKKGACIRHHGPDCGCWRKETET
jgi:hypothetical protein